MHKHRLTVIGLLVVTLVLNTCVGVRALDGDVDHVQSAQSTPQLAQSSSASEALLMDEQAFASLEAESISPASYLQTDVALSAPHSTISWDARDPARSRFELPLLYLRRGRAAAPEPERTLDVEITDLSGGVEIQLELTSRHVDISTGDYHKQVKRIALPDRACSTDDPCNVQWILDPSTMRSGFYGLRLRDVEGKLLWERTYPDRPDLVALDTWDVPLGTHTVRVTYANLFPFARGKNDLPNRLAPDAVANFIAVQFVPFIQDTWQTQFDAWGFGQPVHPLWDADNLVEVFITTPPFALFDGTGTYHRSTYNGGQPYPQRRIWWYGSNDAFQAYTTLADAYRVVFAHEFFHVMQWNVSLLAQKPLNAGQASTCCSINRWTNVFIEGQGKFVPSVQYPETEIGAHNTVDIETVESEYMSAANHFLTERLNSSYREMETDSTDKYDAALYWRFLYERYGDMAIVRAALEEMMRHQEMADSYNPDIVTGMPRVMDHAFQRVDGPYQSYEESLIAFARANYALRLENGRCAAAVSECGGFYFDPESVYADPSLEAELNYQSPQLIINGAIPSSYGMDFLEVTLDESAQGKQLRLEFQGEGSGADFNVQIWKLRPGETRQGRPRAVTAEPEVLHPTGDGAHFASIPQIDVTAYDRLALIITRLDGNETADPVGGYGIVMSETCYLALDNAAYIHRSERFASPR